MRFSVGEIAEITGGKLLFGNKDEICGNVFTDSREKTENGLFIPLKGEKFDGHDYILSAVENGASGYLTEKETDVEASFAVLVDDTKKALGKLAKYALKKSGVKVIAVTGSVGKTTTRQFIASIISQMGKTLVTIKNFNNDIGLPLTVLSMDGDEKYAVLEIGMNNFGEISYLSDMIAPDIGVITMIGMSHIENLVSRENIFHAKMEILDGMKKDGVLFVNGDDDFLKTVPENYEIKTEFFGFENGKYSLEIISDSEFIYGGEKYKINISGKHNIINASCAISIAKYLGAERELIQKGLDSFENIGLRQEICNVGNKEIIVDCYNASLDSFKASLSVLSARTAKRKVAILGAIGELGSFMEEILIKVGEEAYLSMTDLLIVCGEFSDIIKKGAIGAGMDKGKILEFPDKTKLINNINDILKDGDCVLIKASRKYKFEEIFEAVKP